MMLQLWILHYHRYIGYLTHSVRGACEGYITVTAFANISTLVNEYSFPDSPSVGRLRCHQTRLSAFEQRSAAPRWIS